MSLERDVRVLAQIPLFAQLAPEALRLLAFSAEKINLGKEEVLFGLNAYSDSGYVLMAGSLIVSSGLESKPPSTIHAPALLGENALLVETNRPADATSGEASVVMKIPRTLFLRVMLEFPESAEKLRGYLGGRLVEFVRELEAARRLAESRLAN